MKSRNEDEPVISEREKKAWTQGKTAKRSPRPELNASQIMKFVELVSQLRTSGTFERKLGLSPSDVEFYKNKLDIDSQDEARVMLRKLRRKAEAASEASYLVEARKAREAEEVANKRLAEMEKRRAVKKPVTTLNQAEVAEEDAVRQRRFTADQEAKIIEDETWELPLEGTESQRQAQIDALRKDIQYRGVSFCTQKYATTPKALKAESHRLGLKVQWDRVKR